MKSLEQLHEICERMRKVVQLREENAKEILEKAAMCESGKDADGNTYRTQVLICIVLTYWSAAEPDVRLPEAPGSERDWKKRSKRTDCPMKSVLLRQVVSACVR